MTKGRGLALGLSLIADAVVGASFYNSSGSDAIFFLSRLLTAEEQRLLSEFRFWDYSEQPGQPGAVASICFSEWQEQR